MITKSFQVNFLEASHQYFDFIVAEIQVLDQNTVRVEAAVRKSERSCEDKHLEQLLGHLHDLVLTQVLLLLAEKGEQSRLVMLRLQDHQAVG